MTVSKTKMNSVNHGLILLTLVWLRRAGVTAQDSIKWACHVTCEKDDKLYYCGAGCCKIHPWILRIVWLIGTLLIDPRAAHDKKNPFSFVRKINKLHIKIGRVFLDKDWGLIFMININDQEVKKQYYWISILII